MEVELDTSFTNEAMLGGMALAGAIRRNPSQSGLLLSILTKFNLNSSQSVGKNISREAKKANKSPRESPRACSKVKRRNFLTSRYPYHFRAHFAMHACLKKRSCLIFLRVEQLKRNDIVFEKTGIEEEDIENSIDTLGLAEDPDYKAIIDEGKVKQQAFLAKLEQERV